MHVPEESLYADSGMSPDATKKETHIQHDGEAQRSHTGDGGNG